MSSARRSPTRRPSSRLRSGRGSLRWLTCRRCCGAPNARLRSSAEPAGPLGRARRSPASPNASTCRSSARSAARAPSTASMTITPAKSVSPPTRSSGRGSRTPTSSCSSAAGCRKRPRRVMRCSTSPSLARGSFTSMPTRWRSAAIIIPRWGSSRHRRNSAPRSKASIRRRQSRGRRKRVRRERTISTGASRPRQIPAACN